MRDIKTDSEQGTSVAEVMIVDAYFRFPCPNPACGKRLKALLDQVGKRVRCSCGQSLVVPDHPVPADSSLEPADSGRERADVRPPSLRESTEPAKTNEDLPTKPPAEDVEDTDARNTFALFYGIPSLPGIMCLVYGLQQERIGLAAVGAGLIVFSVVGAVSLFVKRKRATTLANAFTMVGVPLGAVAGFIVALANSDETGEFWSVKGLAGGGLAGGMALRPFGWLVGLCADMFWGGQEAGPCAGAIRRS